MKFDIKKLKSFYEQIDFAVIEELSLFSSHCGRGCSNCCYQKIKCSDEEAYYILENCGELINWETVDKQSKFTDKQWQKDKIENRRCVFLKNNECSIYDFRPMTCRQYLVANNPEFCHPESTKKVSIVNSHKKLFIMLCYAFLYNTDKTLPERLINLKNKKGDKTHD